MIKGIPENLITNTTFINKIPNFHLKTRNIIRTSASETKHCTWSRAIEQETKHMALILYLFRNNSFTQRKNPKNSLFQSYLLLSQFNSQNVKLHTHISAEFLFWEQWTIQKEIKKKKIYIYIIKNIFKNRKLPICNSICSNSFLLLC